jgi:uncharacterized protein YciI
MSDSPSTFLLLYTYGPDILERRGPYREEHLQRIRAEREAGRVSLAGALGQSPPDDAGAAQEGEAGRRAGGGPTGGAIVFTGVTREDVQRFVDGDPYVTAGLVTDQRIEPWTLV